MTRLLNQTIETYPGINIKIATRYKLPYIGSSIEYLSLKAGMRNDGLLWNKLLRNIQTPYVFIGFNLYQFDEFINFERMVITRS